MSEKVNDLIEWTVQFVKNKDLIQKQEIISRIQKEVNELNKQLGVTEQIKRFRLVCDQWSPETGELSHKLSLKRKVIYKKYDHILKEIYKYAPDEVNRADKKVRD